VTDLQNAFDPASAAYAAIRALWFCATTLLIGAVAFRLAIRSRSRLAVGAALIADRRAARIGMAAAAASLLAAGLRFIAQSISVFGSLSRDALVLITATTWGRGFVLHVASALAALIAFAAARPHGSASAGDAHPDDSQPDRAARPAAWWIAAIAAVAAGIAPAFSGHAIASAGQPLPVLADSLHVLAAGVWIGSLFVIMLVAAPPSPGARVPLAPLINAFSPIALAGASVLLVTGAFAGWIHLGAIARLADHPWGRLLSAKVIAFAATAAVGAYNFRRLRPTLGHPATDTRLRRSAAIELTLALLIIVLTAFLAGTSPPTE
jgi:copper transport protein